MTLSETPPAGDYLVQAGGAEGGIQRGFSANIPAAATELGHISADQLTALLGAGRFRLAHGREEIDRSVSVGRVGRELYPLLIVLVALILGAEHLLANRFYRGVNDSVGRPRLAPISGGPNSEVAAVAVAQPVPVPRQPGGTPLAPPIVSPEPPPPPAAPPQLTAVP